MHSPNKTQISQQAIADHKTHHEERMTVLRNIGQNCFGNPTSQIAGEISGAEMDNNTPEQKVNQFTRSFKTTLAQLTTQIQTYGVLEGSEDAISDEDLRKYLESLNTLLNLYEASTVLHIRSSYFEHYKTPKNVLSILKPILTSYKDEERYRNFIKYDVVLNILNKLS